MRRPRARLSETFSDPRVELGMSVGMLCALPLLLALWWAPGLVVFQDANLRTALGASLRASLANWRPMLVWCLAVFFFTTILPSVVGQLLWLLLPASIAGAAMAVLFIVYMWSIVAVMQISDYVSYRDVFHSGETLAPIERPPRNA
jgi:hypothetical protein